MKTRFLLSLLVLLPIISAAQHNPFSLAERASLQSMKNAQNLMMQSLMMQQSQNHIQIAESKLAKREKNKTKLDKEFEKFNTKLKTKQEELTTLKNNPENNNTPDIQKEIKKCEREIEWAEKSLNTTKTRQELNSKKIEDLKTRIQKIKLENEAFSKKQKEKRIAKKEKKRLKKESRIKNEE